ncbi:MAG: hypothetical protein J6W64_00110 [Bacilli bacterium]|nr:hypothetical protein [Bacilli bacterium]
MDKDKNKDKRIEKFVEKIKEIAEKFADENGILTVLHGIIDGKSYTPPTPESVKGIADAFLQEIKDSKVFSKFTHDDTNTNNDVTGLRIRYTDKPNTNDSELIDLVDITGRFNSTNLFSLVKLTFSAKTIGRVSFGNAYGPFDITFTAYGDKSTMSISPNYEQLCDYQRGRSAILEAGLNTVVDYYKVFSILENTKPDTIQKPSSTPHQLTPEEQAALDAEQAAKNKDDYIKRKNDNIKTGISKLDIMSNDFYYSLGFLAATTKSITAIIPVPAPDPDSPCKYVEAWFDNRFGYSTPRKNPQTERSATNPSN